MRIFAGRVSTGNMETSRSTSNRSGCIPRAHGPEAVDVRRAVGYLNPVRHPSWPMRLAMACQVPLQPGPCGRSLPGQRAPEFFPEQNGGRPMTRAMEQGMDAPARVLRLPRVQARTGLARSTIYVRVANGSFPQPIRLGARAVGWIESEVDAWIREQIAASRSSG